MSIATNDPIFARPVNLPGAGASEKILYAEDNDLLREPAVRILRSAGYSVVAVPDGAAAYDALRTEPFDLLITDNDMPRLSGLDLISRLRLRGFDLPIIVTSGDGALAKTPCERLGVSCCLQKPFEIRELLRMIRQVLRSSPAAAIPGFESTQAVQPRHWGLNE
jgi:two-component system OmpR family response regulator